MDEDQENADSETNGDQDSAGNELQYTSGDNLESINLELNNDDTDVLRPMDLQNEEVTLRSEEQLEEAQHIDADVEEENLESLEEDQADFGLIDDNEEISDSGDSDDSSQSSDLDEELVRAEAHHGMRQILFRRNLLPRFPRLVFNRLRRYAHIFRNIQFVDEEESDDETEDTSRPESITFDKSLPTSHLYLGEMNDCSGIQYMDQESFVTLPILRVPDFILVPGQTMPLNITQPQEVSLLKHVLKREDKTFGVIMLKNAYGIGAATIGDFGCTAELRSMREEEVYEVKTMVGIAIGRQRFKVMEKRRQPDGNLFAKVQILNDSELSSPASGARLAIHHKIHIPPVKSTRKRHLQHSNRMSPAWLTATPPWVYNMYDVRTLRLLLIKELKDWNHELDEKTLPKSPSAFSFWIASHLMITNTMREYLLKIDCSIQRLRCELDLLKRCTIYACIHCGNQITQKKHLFNMSESGPMDAYVNPSGHIHETLTVYVTQGLVRVSRPSTEHSWFPGYAWTICECAGCARHIGWKFTATKDSLTPKKFWGLTRSSLFPKVETDDMIEKREEPVTRRRRLTSGSSTSSMSPPPHSNIWRPLL